MGPRPSLRFQGSLTLRLGPAKRAEDFRFFKRENGWKLPTIVILDRQELWVADPRAGGGAGGQCWGSVLGVSGAPARLVHLSVSSRRFQRSRFLPAGGASSGAARSFQGEARYRHGNVCLGRVSGADR